MTSRPVVPATRTDVADARARRLRRVLVLGLVLAALVVLLAAQVATAGGAHATVGPTPPAAPDAPAAPGVGEVTVQVNGINGTPSGSIVVLLGITLLSVAPSLLLLTTSFTKMIVVLSLTRNALGLQGVPPNQVLAGIALFLSLFVMAPVVGSINDLGVQPYLDGSLTFTQAVEAGQQPLRQFMLAHTREEDIALLTRAAEQPNPQTPADVPFTVLAPAFLLSELRAAFIMGFVIFVPFLVIDLVVSAALMAMGMMMLPPVMVSLPFKLLLFVLVDGWGLVVTALVGSYAGGG
ncbi:flagellar type III secretion system pore protein FliP [Cellulomonas wangsupingiae]|uniref:Flagellar biosynthetic protein FliP n=1 Tax=Cellulomonas wangsupingiae TaxID=2968085 RepID=A0ABY5K9U3_9CELL|nr:flagellar type III secretion system pore protein FliP [Cellulomonas wangsupingiae]MCC2334166.1 flagellar type III secretion system pore protein FliP [Cellulomonas wangsupingiae]UUI65845.1 flagellar type III secretion system pore protein FliP [Cellulomonas wangsupingiae]